MMVISPRRPKNRSGEKGRRFVSLCAVHDFALFSEHPAVSFFVLAWLPGMILFGCRL